MKTKFCGVLAFLLISRASMPCGAEVALPAGKTGPAPALSPNPITLQDDRLRVVFDSGTGALIGLEDKTVHWTIERRPEFGVSFRLFAPMPDRRWNPVLGQKQLATEVKKISDHQLHFRWDKLAGESSGVIPISVTADITLTNGTLTFNSTLKNDSACTVETMDYPYFGDLSAPSRASAMQARVMTNNQPGGRLRSDDIYPHFSNEKGYWGAFWPTKMRDTETSKFCLISSTNAGFYLEVADRPYRLVWTFEQHPGFLSSINTMVPPEDEIAGTPVHLEFRACHYIFTGPGASTNLTPVTLHSYEGDWHVGANLYANPAATSK